MLDPIIDDARVQNAVAQLPHAPLFVTVSGAHLYGFASPDSDVDLRGAHLSPLRDLVGLFPARETLEISRVEDGLEWDIVTHEARKFFALLAKNSGYALEQLLSPLVVWARPEHEELCAIARRHLSRQLLRHYLGFAQGQWRLFEKESPPRVKPLLYVYRVLLSGLHVMKNGEIQADLRVLNAEYGSSAIADLIVLKSQTREKITLDADQIPFQRAEFETLFQKLRDSENSSPLPAKSDSSSQLHDLLLRLRGL